MCVFLLLLRELTFCFKDLGHLFGQVCIVKWPLHPSIIFILVSCSYLRIVKIGIVLMFELETHLSWFSSSIKIKRAKTSTHTHKTRQNKATFPAARPDYQNALSNFGPTSKYINTDALNYARWKWAKRFQDRVNLNVSGRVMFISWPCLFVLLAKKPLTNKS